MFARLGAVLCGLAIALGSFGAHGLEKMAGVTPDRVDAFMTGVRYQFWHGLALLAVSLGAREMLNARFAKLTAWLWMVGAVIFSGALYLLVLLNQPMLGMVAPLGGVSLMVGWGVLVGSLKKPEA